MRRVLAGCAVLAACTLGGSAHGADATPTCKTPGTPADTIAATADLLDTLVYTVHTDLRRARGDDIARDTPALMNVPTPVNVDGDLAGSPELIVTLSATSTEHASLTVEKVDAAPASLPVRVEARVNVPGNPVDDVEIAFGYDARESTLPGSLGSAPRSFATDFDFVFGQRLEDEDGNAVAGSRSRLSSQVTVTGAGKALTVVGETFINTQLGKRDRKAAAAKLTPVPPSLRLSAVMTCRVSTETVEFDAASDTPTVVKADLADEREASDPRGLPVTLRRNARATIQSLPRTVAVDFERDPELGRETVSYSGAAAVGLLDVTIDDLKPDSLELERQVHAVLRDVPAAGFTLTRGLFGADSDRTAVALDADGGPIGSVEAGAAAGRPVSLLAAPQSFFAPGELAAGAVPGYAFSDGADVTFRIAGLSHAAVDTADPLGSDATGLRIEATSRQQPFLVRQLKAARIVNARILNLPADLTLRVSKDPRRVEYEASQTIGRLRVTAHDPDGLIDRPSGTEPTVAVVDVDGVPRCLTLDVVDGGLHAETRSGVDNTTCPSDAIGRAEALITTGTPLNPVLPADENAPPAAADGIALEERTGRFTLLARASSVRGLSFRTDEKAQSTTDVTGTFVDTQQILTAGLDHPEDVARAFSVKVEREDARRYLDARLASIPRTLDLTVTNHDARRIDQPGNACTPENRSLNLCEEGLEIDYEASSAITAGVLPDAFTLDTNAGLRQPLNTSGQRVAGLPNLRLEVKRLPRTVAFCKATNGLCVPGGSGRFVGDLSLRLDASEALRLDLFDCKEAGLDGVCDPAQRGKLDQQVSTVADIESVRVAEFELDRPPIRNDLRGHAFLNTTKNTVVHQIDGDGNGPTGNDLFIHSRSSDSCNEGKIKRLEADFAQVSARDRLVVFEIDNGFPAPCTAGGLDVVDSSGTMRCVMAGTQIDAALGFPGGDISNDLCDQRL